MSFPDEVIYGKSLDRDGAFDLREDNALLRKALHWIADEPNGELQTDAQLRQHYWHLQQCAKLVLKGWWT